jgi:hypothetical protein
MDCDGQHQPERIPVLLEAIHDADVVSGSRYYRDFRQDTPAPTDRRFINATITREINARYGLNLTDAFCGFKAYRRAALEKLSITERGWGMPLQLWVQAARQVLRVKEIGVPRLYLDPTRAFGGVMNDPEQRLAYYRAGAGVGRARRVARGPGRGALLEVLLMSRRFRAPRANGEVLAEPASTRSRGWSKRTAPGSTARTCESAECLFASCAHSRGARRSNSPAGRATARCSSPGTSRSCRTRGCGRSTSR